MVKVCFSHNYAEMKNDSHDSLTLEKTATLHYLIIIIKSVFNKNQNYFCYNIFLEKWFC